MISAELRLPRFPAFCTSVEFVTHPVFDVVVDNEVELFVGEGVVFCEDPIIFSSIRGLTLFWVELLVRNLSPFSRYRLVDRRSVQGTH